MAHLQELGHAKGGARWTYENGMSDCRRIEIERRRSEDDYLDLLKYNRDPERRPIRKTRYCLSYDRQYFEIDVYPFWQDKAIVEIEVSDEEQEVRFPKELHVIKEVTRDPMYKNAALAKYAAEADA